MIDTTLYIVTDQGPSTGIGTYADSLSELVRDEFSEVKLVSLCYLPVEERPTWSRVPGTRFARSRLDIPSTLRSNEDRLRRTLSSESAVHLCGTSYRLAAYFRRPVVTVHDFYPRRPSIRNARDPTVFLRDLSSLGQFLVLPKRVRGSAEVVVPSGYVREELARRAGIASTVISHWVDERRFHPRNPIEARKALGLPTDDSLVLNVSVGASNKNYGLIERIARGLGDGFRLVKLGGTVREVPGAIQIPNLPYDAYPLVFNACDVYLHTSIQEGFGLPQLEALACELPVVSSDNAVSREILGQAGTFVRLSDPVASWISAVKRVAEAGERQRVVSDERARMSRFSPSTARDAYCQVYQRAFGR